MFGYLFHGIKSIHFQTELHEACDWDDEELEKVMNKVTVVLENIKLPDIPCDFSFFKENVLVPELAQQNLSKNQIKIIINYMEHNAKFVSHILGQPEN